MKVYGTCLEIGTHAPHVASSNTNQVDFWSEHENESLVPKKHVSSNSSQNTDKLPVNLSDSQKTSPIASRAALSNSSAGPNVSLANTSDNTSKDYKPSLIGNKRSQAKKGVNIYLLILTPFAGRLHLKYLK